MTGTYHYTKEDLIKQYNYLANNQLALNGVYQLVIIIEATLSDFLRKVILKYPQKIGSKMSIKSSLVLSASSIEELHIKTTDSILNDLAYKSPRDFAKACEELLSINFLECPSYHKYIEIKATRDIYIHNLGFINELYLNKVGSHARGQLGGQIPVTMNYFLESYEECIKFIEWLEIQAHEEWTSSEYEDKLAASKKKQADEEGDEQAVKEKVTEEKSASLK